MECVENGGGLRARAGWRPVTRTPAVENKPIAIQPRRQHGMILPNGAVTNQNQLQIITREAGLGEGRYFAIA
jgi:hypothetical protein